jgi:biopolymer transport protein ExbD
MNLLRRHREESLPAFNLAAMIDVVLLLIVFFTMSSQFQQAQQRPRDLPRLEGEDRAYEPSKSMIVDLSVDGSLSSPEGVTLSVAEVARNAADALASVSNDSARLDVVVRADSRTPALHLNRLAAELSRVGVRTWKLATSGEDAPVGQGFTP